MGYRHLTCAVVFPVVFFARSLYAQEPVTRHDPSLMEVHIAIDNREFCSGDNDVYTEKLNLTVRYTNKGKSTLTVFTGTDLPQGTIAAHTVEELKAGKYESELGGALLPMEGGRYMLGSDPATERSITLTTGQSVEAKHYVGVVVSKSESTKVHGTIMSGKHFLKVFMAIKVSDGTINKVTANSLSQHPEFRWVTVPSQPVEFEVPPTPDLKDCSN